MSETTRLHDEAMEWAERADRARRAADHASASAHFARALALERAAAELENTQPSRGILLRSAAWLALEAGDALEGERLAACGLAARDVPARLRNELRAVADDARMQLSIPRPPPSSDTRLSVHLEGPEIGFGAAPPSAIMPRVGALLALVARAAERRAGLPFRRRGQLSTAIQKQLSPCLDMQAASVVIGVRLGGPQIELWDQNRELVTDIRECLDALASGDEAALERLIPDHSYRENFNAIVTTLGPDGRRVTAVDFLGATQGRALPPVRLRRRAPAPRSARQHRGQLDELVGELLAADGTRRRNTIVLVGDDGGTARVRVSEAIMEDIVRPFFGSRVRLRAQRKAKEWILVGLPEPDDE